MEIVLILKIIFGKIDPSRVTFVQDRILQNIFQYTDVNVFIAFNSKSQDLMHQFFLM